MVNYDTSCCYLVVIKCYFWESVMTVRRLSRDERRRVQYHWDTVTELPVRT